jgi:tetratricopeptide (TPR) repeat protein
MERASIGGRANWAGAAFELRLGVEFCVYILVGEAAGLGPGAVRSVQLQAPAAVDDLVLEFETGACWAIQAKAGTSVRVEWNPNRPFGKALRQLHHGATSGQIDLAPDSLDRVELAVDHRAHSSITAFGEWLAKARKHHDWEHFVAASTGREQEWAEHLPVLLEAPPGDELLAFLQKLFVPRAPQPDEWRANLRGRLIIAGVPDAPTADRILDVLLAQVVQVAPHAGQLDYDDLRQACEGIPSLPRPGTPPFRLLHHPSEDDLYQALRMPPTRPTRFVERPELTAALDSDQGVLVAGRPGSGKSHALIKLALARPDWPVVAIARHFRADDLGRLTSQLRRVHTPYQLLWDDVHEKADLFADTVSRLAEREDPARVLAAYRDQHEPAVRERVTPDLCRRAGIAAEPLRLKPFDAGQAAQMVDAVTEALDLTLDEAGLGTLARHIRRGDGGPLFALSTGLLLQEQAASGKPVHAADVARLPKELLATWRHLYEQLAQRANGFLMQSLLNVLHFLHRIDCPLHTRLVELLFTHALDRTRGDFDGAARTLAQEGWLRREEEGFAAHDITLEAVPDEPDTFRRFVQFAREHVAGEELALGLLRGSLSLFYASLIPRTRTAQERRVTTVDAVELGELAIADFRAANHTRYLGTVLNNASVFYSDLAGLEETRQGRVARLHQALQAIEEAARLYRDLGLQADLAMSLNNASNRYSELAGLEETRQGRVARLHQALQAVEEAVRIRRDLGLQADLASSLNNASVFYSDLAGLEETRQGRVARLQQALQAIEEAVQTFRNQGIIPYLIIGLGNAVRRHIELARHTGDLDHARVLALCEEGEALCGPMEDQERLAFFRQVRQQLAEFAQEP